MTVQPTAAPSPPWGPAPALPANITFQVLRGHQAQRYHEGNFLRRKQKCYGFLTRSFPRSFVPQTFAERRLMGLAHLPRFPQFEPNGLSLSQDPTQAPTCLLVSCLLGPSGLSRFSIRPVLADLGSSEDQPGVVEAACPLGFACLRVRAGSGVQGGGPHGCSALLSTPTRGTVTT